MTDEIGQAPDERPEGSSPPPTPRWVKAFAIAALVLVLLVVAVFLIGGHTIPRHGP